MTESERAAAIKTQILNALRAQKWTHFINNGVEVWTPGILELSPALILSGQSPDRFAELMANNLVSIFGGKMFIGLFTEEKS